MIMTVLLLHMSATVITVLFFRIWRWFIKLMRLSIDATTLWWFLTHPLIVHSITTPSDFFPAFLQSYCSRIKVFRCSICITLSWFFSCGGGCCCSSCSCTATSGCDLSTHSCIVYWYPIESIDTKLIRYSMKLSVIWGPSKCVRPSIKGFQTRLDVRPYSSMLFAFVVVTWWFTI